MLDVHAPHESDHTWTDFFIHIATIVVGLCIAVGLEQTVEWFHHRHQVAETREALRNEMAINQIQIRVATKEWHRFVPILQGDLAVVHFLEQHPGAPAQLWPGAFRLRAFHGGFFDDAWKSAQQSGILSLMPTAESRADADIYLRIDALNKREHEETEALNKLKENTMDDPDISHLGRTQLTREIELLHDCLLAEYEVARGLYNLSAAHPELSLSVPTEEDRNRILPMLKTAQDEEDKRAVAAAIDEMVRADSTANPKAK